MALRRASQSPAFWAGRRSRTLTPDLPLSSRVLQSIHADRRKLVHRAGQSAQRAYPVMAYATAVCLLCVFFAFLTQPTIARPWFERYFLARHNTMHAVKHGPVAPPYPMHDPFMPPGAGPSVVAIKPSDRRSYSLTGKVQTASLSTARRSSVDGKPVLYVHPAVPAASDVQAFEAMTTAEKAEDTRIETASSKPTATPAKAVPPGQVAITPSASGLTNGQSPGASISGTITLNDSVNHQTLATDRPAPEVPDALKPNSSSLALSKPVISDISVGTAAASSPIPSATGMVAPSTKAAPPIPTAIPAPTSTH